MTTREVEDRSLSSLEGRKKKEDSRWMCQKKSKKSSNTVPTIPQQQQGSTVTLLFPCRSGPRFFSSVRTTRTTFLTRGIKHHRVEGHTIVAQLILATVPQPNLQSLMESIILVLFIRHDLRQAVRLRKN